MPYITAFCLTVGNRVFFFITMNVTGSAKVGYDVQYYVHIYIYTS
jgi:hypothetical protein